VTVAACVVELPSGRILFARNADEPVIPASNMKLLTSAAALDALGSRFRFRTRLAIRGSELAIVGGGDPALGDPRLAEQYGRSPSAPFGQWAQIAAKAVGGGVISRLVIDDSVFDAERLHPSWPRDEYQKWYCAPVGGLNFADNCVEVRVKPGPAGQTTVTLQPACSLFDVVVRSAGRKTAVTVWRPEGTWRLVIAGTCRKPVRLPPVTVPDPGLFAAGVFRDVLEQTAGISVQETVRAKITDESGNLQEGWREVAIWRSELRDVLTRCNRDSQNLFAECLAKAVGAAVYGRPGSWEKARSAILQFLQKYNLPSEGIVIDDGSGLSRNNRLTARLLAMLLCEMFARPDWPVWRDSLAVGGISGTLRKRFSKALRGRILAKTGYIRGVSALSGYIKLQEQRWIAFSFIYNGIKGSTAKAKAAQHKACHVLYEMLTGQSRASRPAASEAGSRTSTGSSGTSTADGSGGLQGVAAAQERSGRPMSFVLLPGVLKVARGFGL